MTSSGDRVIITIFGTGCNSPHSAALVGCLAVTCIASCPEQVPRFPYQICSNTSITATCTVECDRYAQADPFINFTLRCDGDDWRLTDSTNLTSLTCIALLERHGAQYTNRAFTAPARSNNAPRLIYRLGCLPTQQRSNWITLSCSTRAFRCLSFQQ